MCVCVCVCVPTFPVEDLQVICSPLGNNFSASNPLMCVTMSPSVAPLGSSDTADGGGIGVFVQLDWRCVVRCL